MGHIIYLLNGTINEIKFQLDAISKTMKYI